MQIQPFKGFPKNAEAIPIPSLLFTELLRRIESIGELKVILYIFWLIKHKPGPQRYITYNELLDSSHLFLNGALTATDKKNMGEIVKHALSEAMQHGILIRAEFTINGIAEEVILLNTDEDRIYLRRLINGGIQLPNVSGVKIHELATIPIENIYLLYEQNIGVISPIIADELRKAEEIYPREWIIQAFKEAVELNKRNWRYISRILERWSTEGKDNGKTGGYTKKEKDITKYTRGKFGHMVRR